jgi:hypothetical protein
LRVKKQPKPEPRKIWIVVPTYTGQVAAGTFKSLIHDMAHLIVSGNAVVPPFDIGAADIYMVRAHIVAHFLADPEATDLIMVDADVAWDSFGLQRLLAHDVDVVAGAYPKRQEPLSFMYRSEITLNEVTGKPQKALMGDPNTGLCEVWGVPGGFVRIKRHVLEKMVAHYGPTLTAADGLQAGAECVRLFDPYWITDANGKRTSLSEDYAFCQRWRDIGGKVYLDVNIPMGHVGAKMYHGCLGEWAKPQYELKEKVA